MKWRSINYFNEISVVCPGSNLDAESHKKARKLLDEAAAAFQRQNGQPT
jgi:hypothetical protein